jgi:chaperonin cofactor prefoldin
MSDDWWTERQQNKRLAGLEEDLSYVSSALSSARASQNRLKAELSKVQGSLEQRLNRLSAAFDAFVEISDLRVTLGLFDSHGRVRHQAKQLLAGAGLPELSDVDGYWLAPALLALSGVADGAVDDEALALASARDPLRTATFHVLLTSVLGGRSTVPSLAPALPTLPALPAEVPAYQRAVWLLAADGFFGAEGWELARERCAEFVAGVTDDSLATALREVAVPRAVVQVPKELDGGGSLATALHAAEKLTVLRTWVTEALDGFTNEPDGVPDELARRTLDLLVDEGSAVELPLLARERELRAVIEGKETAKSTWDSPAGTAVDLLGADLASERPNRRALAVRASAPVLLTLAEEFATTARTEAPASLAVRTRHGQVTITPTGPDATSMRKALDLVARSANVESQRKYVAIGAGVVGVLLVVLAVFAGWGWVFPALIALGVAGYQWFADGKERKNAAEQAEVSRKALVADVDQRVESFAKLRRELQDRQSAVDADLTALRAALS